MKERNHSGRRAGNEVDNMTIYREFHRMACVDTLTTRKMKSFSIHIDDLDNLNVLEGLFKQYLISLETLLSIQLDIPLPIYS